MKVIDLAMELGVTSRDLILAFEGMGHKGMRAMSPLLKATADEIRALLAPSQQQAAGARPWPARPVPTPLPWVCASHVGEQAAYTPPSQRYWGTCEACMMQRWREERARRVRIKVGVACNLQCRRGRAITDLFNCTCICVGWHHQHRPQSQAARLLAALQSAGEAAPPVGA